MEYRFLKESELNEALHLIQNEFDKKIASFYSNEGVDSFKKFCQLPFFLELMKKESFYMIGCFDNELVGVIGVDDNHINVLFVKEEYTNQGIGSELLNKVKLLCDGNLTVNAFFKVYDFYVKNEFYGEEKIIELDGIKYIPLEYKKEKQTFSTYDEVHAFIQSQKQRVYALDHFKKFMKFFNNPQNDLKTLHIGGTNGKGSTTNYLREVLQLAGYKVATFTSPALESRLDVMRINDLPIDDKTIIKYANKYMDICLDFELSMFEIEVFIAVQYFIDQHVDFAIFEVGLGGELDATNIIDPILSVNTNIGMDHVDYLGDTYEKIARTKAGIVKDGKPYIVGENKEECLRVFKEICDQKHSQLIRVKDIKNIVDNGSFVSFEYEDMQVNLSTGAIYQCKNAALALEVLLYLKEKGIANLSREIILKGLSTANWKGRFEVMRKEPLIIIDGAHNKEGIEAFCQSAKIYSDIKIIFSALRDKDTHAMIEKLLEITDDVTICEFEHYRAQKAKILAEDFPVKIEEDWKKAVKKGLKHSGTLFITGSLYFISQVRTFLIENLE